MKPDSERPAPDDPRPSAEGPAREPSEASGEASGEEPDEGDGAPEPLEAWLWDPSEPPGDALGASLEAALRGSRFEPERAPLALPPRAPRRVTPLARARRLAPLALAATLLLGALAVLLTVATRRPSSEPSTASLARGSWPLARRGAPGPCEGERGLAFWASAPVRCGAGRPVRLGRLPTSSPERGAGDTWLEVPSGARARVLLERGIGHVDAHEGARLRALPAEGEGQTLDLERGALYAKVTAPPRIFRVTTPGARVVDLGCEYSLVSRGRDLELYVVSGYVELANERGEVLVPALHRSLIEGGGRPRLPIAIDAPAPLATAAARAEEGDVSALAGALPYARLADVLTLAQLLERVPSRERRLVAERVVALAPLAEPPRVEAALAGDREALVAWRTALQWALFDGSTLAKPVGPVGPMGPAGPRRPERR